MFDQLYFPFSLGDDGLATVAVSAAGFQQTPRQECLNSAEIAGVRVPRSFRPVLWVTCRAASKNGDMIHRASRISKT